MLQLQIRCCNDFECVIKADDDKKCLISSAIAIPAAMV